MTAISESFSADTLRLLAEASAVINSSLDFQTVLDNIATSAARVMRAEASSVIILDRSRNKLRFVAATGDGSEDLIGTEFESKKGIAGRVIERGKPEIVQDVQSDADFYGGIDKMTDVQTQSMIAAPMIVASEVIGVVELLNPIAGRFDENDLSLLEVFANLAAVAARNARDHQKLRERHENLCAEVLRKDQIIGDSAALSKVANLCTRVAASDATVLLLGETGTGKELFAKFVHNQSKRVDQPFVAIHCAALSETLLESELFGHEKGAFTGATGQHVGKFESAEGGTVFLDEVGEIPLQTQVKLLRVLQEREFERVGGSATIKCDVRVVAATNRDLKAEISAGTFREDLFYRLNVFPVNLPPLRERRDDIPKLVEYFVGRAAGKMGLAAPAVSPGSSAVLMRYDWPGNVRELENIMERAVIMCNGQSIEGTDLPVEIAGMGGDEGGSETEGTLWGYERAMIVKALKDNKWNQTAAAKHLGISRDNLRYRVKKYGIEKGE